jgi:hypothetical protein
MLEYWGLGAILAVWRYFFDIDWDLRIKRRRRRSKRPDRA